MRLRPRREFIEFDYFYLRNCIVVGFNERESMERGNERIKRFKNPLSRHDAEKLICRSFERTFINNKEQLLRNGIKILQFRRLRSLIRMLLRKSDRLNCFFISSDFSLSSKRFDCLRRLKTWFFCGHRKLHRLWGYLSYDNDGCERDFRSYEMIHRLRETIEAFVEALKRSEIDLWFEVRRVIIHVRFLRHSST